MYRYDEFDARFVRERVEQFRGQVKRRLAGELTEDQFKPLRLQNGVYLQLHAYMLRVAIPYGTLSSKQMRMLSHVARIYDRGWGHFTTRQNIQYNWPALERIPDVLDELADVEMHAIQTSGNCIRNVTTDHFAGAAADEIIDPRPYAEITRQWSSLHPEFAFLPRKFKIAFTGAPTDRAAIRFHDIGIQATRNDDGIVGFRFFVGGGMGRTPMIGKEINNFVAESDLLAYMEAIVRVYNRYGRRDNKYKARIKILVHETGIDKIREEVEAEFAALKDGPLNLPEAERERITAYFAMPPLEPHFGPFEAFEKERRTNEAFARFADRNLHPHRIAGHVCLTISLKPIGGVPGDATAEQMDIVANLAERYGHDEIRVSHAQNLVLPHIAKNDVPTIYKSLVEAGLGEANCGLATDIISCPGLDYCTLANARSIPVAQRVSERFADPVLQSKIGDLQIKISGCINACGHHHAGHIGVLGVDRKGEELYQITLGGSPDEEASIGSIIGRGFSEDKVVDAIDTIIATYLKKRTSTDEAFLTAYRRLGDAPFKEALYENA